MYKIRLLFKDLTYEKNTFFCTIAIIVFVNFCFVTALNLVGYYREALDNVKDRLGADIMIVSKGYDSEMKDSLFLGNPSTIKFDSKKLLKRIANQHNVANASPQLFLSSLESTCCKEKLQFIIFDSKSDKIINSWIRDYKGQVDGRNIIVGNDIEYEIGEKVIFFDVVFCVAGKLRKTGMGYDSCVFLDEKSSESLVKFWGEKNIKDKASIILVDLKDKTIIDRTLKDINNIVDGQNLVGYKSKEIYNDISNNISNIEYVVNIFLIIIVVISTISLYAINSMKIQDKKKDIELLNILGITNYRIIKILISEQLLISLIGSLIGGIASLFTIAIFKNNLQMLLNIKIELGLHGIKYCTMSSFVTICIGVISIICSIVLYKRNNK